MAKSNNLILMVGPPYSGKTTKALEMGYPIVSPDAVRLSLHGQRFISEAEYMVWPFCVMLVKALFAAGHRNVTVDATNNTKKRRDFWREAGDWGLAFATMDTSGKVCIERAEAAGDAEIIPVIVRMADEHEPVTTEEYR